MVYPVPFREAKSKYWYFHFVENGKRKKISTRCLLKKDALKFVQDYVEQKGSSLSIQTFAEFQKPFYNWNTCPHVERRIDEGKSMGERHVGQARRLLDNHVLTDPIFPALRMDQITRGDILELRTRLKEKLSGKTNTLNKTISAVKAIFSEAYFREKIETDPGAKIGAIQEDRDEREVLNLEELNVLFFDPPGMFNSLEAYDFFFVLANTGMRSGELRAFKWDMWDRKGRSIKVRRAWKSTASMGPPKWGKMRDIPVTHRVASIIEGQRTKDFGEFVFGYPDGSHYGATWVTKNFKSAIGKSGLAIDGRKITPHCLRHSVNTLLLSKGVNPLFVQAYLGWAKDSPITSTQDGYTHLKPEHLMDIPNYMETIWNH